MCQVLTRIVKAYAEQGQVGVVFTHPTNKERVQAFELVGLYKRFGQAFLSIFYAPEALSVRNARKSSATDTLR